MLFYCSDKRVLLLFAAHAMCAGVRLFSWAVGRVTFLWEHSLTAQTYFTGVSLLSPNSKMAGVESYNLGSITETWQDKSMTGVMRWLCKEAAQDEHQRPLPTLTILWFYSMINWPRCTAGTHTLQPQRLLSCMHNIDVLYKKSSNQTPFKQ